MTLPTATLEALRSLQTQIGAANAEKGFHDEGKQILGGRSLGTVAYANRRSAIGVLARWIQRLLPALERNYWTARLSLLTTEVAEAIEELRNGRRVNETYYSGGTIVLTEGDNSSWEDIDTDSLGKPRKPEGVPSEVADVVIRAFDFAEEAQFDLADIIARKLAYNATRAKMHGRKF